jgi:hypothetical protein
MRNRMNEEHKEDGVRGVDPCNGGAHPLEMMEERAAQIQQQERNKRR